MEAEHTTGADPGRDWFIRLAGAVADFGNPFYEEERQRDVWNEASALGLQVVLWLGLLMATVLVWVGGRTAMPYALGLVGLVGFSSLVTVVYARRLGVDGAERQRVLRLRLVPFLVMLLALMAGVVRAGALPVAAGLGTGAAAALVTIVRRSE